jgi:phosphoesterase RecJ-like protein
MRYQTPSHRREPARRLAARLAGAHSVVLTTHINPDADGVGSAVALLAWLRDRGAEGWFVPPTPLPERYRFLLPEDEWHLPAKTTEAARACSAADLIVVVDAGDLRRLGRVKPMVEGRPTVVVDHHTTPTRPIPGDRLVDTGACATAELVYDILLAAGARALPSIDNALYAAIADDTGSFAYSNVTPDTHLIASELVRRGVDTAGIHRRLFESMELRRLQLLRECLGELRAEDGLSWITVPDQAYRTLKATSDDLEGLVNYPRALKGVEVAMLFRTTNQGGTKVSFRSNGSVDVDGIARRFGGGGHAKAAGALVRRPLEDVRADVVEAARALVRE